MAQRCGVWQIKRMTSQDQDQVSMKSNMFGFRGYSQMKFYKTYKTAEKGLFWFVNHASPFGIPSKEKCLAKFLNLICE